MGSGCQAGHHKISALQQPLPVTCHFRATQKQVNKRKLISQRHPILYFLAIWTRRLKRIAEWKLDSKKYSKTKMHRADSATNSQPAAMPARWR
jgi:hypothetical protein